MRSIMFVFFVVIFWGNLNAQQALNDYLLTAARNNPALKASFDEYRLSLEKIPQVGTLPDPTLAFGYFILPIETKNGPQQAKISFTQMFPWFGTLQSREDVLVAEAKARYEAFEDAKSALFFEVKAAYYKLYFINKAMEINRHNIEVLEAIQGVVLIKVEAAAASASDELRLEMELNTLRNDLAVLDDQWQVNVVRFNSLLNVAKNSRVSIPGDLPPDSLQFNKASLMDSIRLNNHRLLRLDYLTERYQHSEAAAHKTGSPTLILGIDYMAIGKSSTQPDAGRDALMIKAGFTLPLYRKKYSAMVNEALIAQSLTANKKEAQINLLTTLLEKADADYRDAVRRMRLYLKQKELSLRAMRLLENEYALNGKNFDEVLRMERKTLSYTLEYEKAKADRLAALAFIDYLKGL